MARSPVLRLTDIIEAIERVRDDLAHLERACRAELAAAKSRLDQ